MFFRYIICIHYVDNILFMHHIYNVQKIEVFYMYHNADRRRTIGKITEAMPGIDGDRIKYSPTSANVREKP